MELDIAKHTQSKKSTCFYFDGFPVSTSNYNILIIIF